MFLSVLSKCTFFFSFDQTSSACFAVGLFAVSSLPYGTVSSAAFHFHAAAAQSTERSLCDIYVTVWNHTLLKGPVPEQLVAVINGGFSEECLQLYGGGAAPSVILIHTDLQFHQIHCVLLCCSFCAPLIADLLCTSSLSNSFCSCSFRDCFAVLAVSLEQVVAVTPRGWENI